MLPFCCVSLKCFRTPAIATHADHPKSARLLSTHLSAEIVPELPSSPFQLADLWARPCHFASRQTFGPGNREDQEGRPGSFSCAGQSLDDLTGRLSSARENHWLCHASQVGCTISEWFGRLGEVSRPILLVMLVAECYATRPGCQKGWIDAEFCQVS